MKVFLFTFFSVFLFGMLLLFSGCAQTQSDRAAFAQRATLADPSLAPDFCKHEKWRCN